MSNVDKTILTDSRYRLHTKYWRNFLSCHAGSFDFQIKKKPNNGKVPQAFHNFILEAKQYKSIIRLTKENDTGVFVCILSIFTILLRRYTNQKDVIIDSPLNTLNIGNEIYTQKVPLLIKVKDDDSLKDHLNNVRDTIKESYKYQNFPVELINEGEDSFTTNVFIQYQSIHRPPNKIGFYDLIISIEKDEEIKINLQYSREAFEEGFINNIQLHFLKALDYINELSIPIKAIEILSAKEKRFLEGINNKDINNCIIYKTVDQLFKRNVKSQSDAVAIVFENHHITYQELDEKSNQLSNYILENHEVNSNSFVGLIFDNSDSMVLSILATIKAGITYIPIDINYPLGRIYKIVNDASIKILITDKKDVVNDAILRKSSEVLLLNNLEQIGSFSKEKVHKLVVPNELAYIMYTSGTTGIPKGVIIEQKSIINLVYGLVKSMNLKREWKYILSSSIGFDASVKQLFLPLIAGAQLHIFKNIKDISNLIRYISIAKINVLHLSPEVWKQFLLSDNFVANFCSSLKVVSSGGDILTKDLAKKISNQLPGCKIYNTYGPTEVCVNASTFSINGGSGYDPLPIGKAMPNYEIYILDDHLGFQPLGTIGEICISGIGVSLGYLNQPSLTKQKFVNNPFDESQKLYLTGDLGRLLPDGNIEFVGRKDNQIKIRGFRIEPGEIEQVILNYNGPIDAKTIVNKGPNGEKRLIAFVKGKKNLGLANIKSHLREYLPSYMIPEGFILLEEFPLKLNGKLDEVALQKLANESLFNYTQYVAPRNVIEKKLISIWQKLLGADNIGIKDRFFDLGGHSLKAMQLVSRILAVFKVQIDLKDVLSNPDIEGLSKLIGDSSKKSEYYVPVIEEQEYYKLSYPQKRLWYMHYLQESKLAYNMVAGYIIEGELQTNAFQKALDLLTIRHETLRTTFLQKNDDLIQKVHFPNYNLKIAYQDLRIDPKKDERCNNIFDEEVNRNFDLTKYPLWKTRLVQIEAKKHLFIINIHHILSDAWSNQIMMNEVLDLYARCKENIDAILPPMFLQYKDYSAWNNRFSTPNYYWETVFSDRIPILSIPYDFQESKRFSNEGRYINIVVNRNLYKRLKNLATDRGYSLSTVLFSAYNILLSKWCLTTDFVVGTLASGRNRVELEGIVGIFINFLPIRSYINGKLLFDEYLKLFGTELNKAYTNQDYPFELLVEQYYSGHETIINPFYNTLFNYNFVEGLNNEHDYIEKAGLKITSHKADQLISFLDLKVDVFDNGEQLKISFEYDPGLFKEKTIKVLVDRYVKLLELLSRNPKIKLDSVELFDNKELEKIRNNFSKSNDLTINLFSSFVIDPAVDYLKYWLKESDYCSQVNVGDNNQLFHQLINKATSNDCENTLNILYFRFEDYLHDQNGGPQSDSIKSLERMYIDLKNIIVQLSGSQQKYLVCLLPISERSVQSKSLIDFIRKLTTEWEKFLSSIGGLHVINLTEIASLYDIREIFDPISYEMGKIPFTQEFYAALGTYTARRIISIKSPGYKVIVVDCDNTLWKGICGEDGLTGISIEAGHKYLQRFLIKKYSEGFLLALCSKNNEEDVWNIFSSHPEMILSKKHIIAAKINWCPKSDNIKEISSELNLDLNSFIFIDDSPIECGEMMTRHPEILSLQLPVNSNEYPGFLNHVWAFDRYSVTQEDKRRNELYQREKERKVQKKNYASIDEYINSLKVKVEIKELQEDQTERASQLTFRTNQFNLNGLHISETKIYDLLKKKSVKCWMITVCDQFGDYGFTGLVIFNMTKEMLNLSTFLLSCRVLGRGVEYAVLTEIAKYCKKAEIKYLSLNYISTPKNVPIKRFLDEIGLTNSSELISDQFSLEKLDKFSKYNTVVNTLYH